MVYAKAIGKIRLGSRCQPQIRISKIETNSNIKLPDDKNKIIFTMADTPIVWII